MEGREAWAGRKPIVSKGSADLLEGLVADDRDAKCTDAVVEADQRKLLVREVEEVIESLVADSNFVRAHALRQELVKLKGIELD